ncbi:hypothetical protein OS493_030683 [Desmophyllum pertusum]|uniref:Fibrinogen C-terminal domain-containing protein n=1 Tax=Desmophyllum pertusum TaxID=174260 RepID=A0A9W9Z9T7_9CNID|nr:hypothetical protein OS493_030683 [Desmophyllum pertusum]
MHNTLYHGVRFALRVEVLLVVVFALLVYQVVSQVYIDGSKALKRDAGDGVAYANFAAHKFRYLNLAPLISALVTEHRECAKLCVDHSSCFSTNLAATRDNKGRIKCELLPSDKYNNSNKLLDSAVFHHLSIKAAKRKRIQFEHFTENRLSQESGSNCPGINCHDIKSRGLSEGDGLYRLDPDAGSHSNAFLAYCDMTSYNGGWTMCYTTDEYVNPRTEVTYSAQFPYGSDGYRTNCNNIPFTEIIFVDHQTGNKAYFKRHVNQTITAADNYGNTAGTYGLWEGVGAVDNAYSYQLLICDDSLYSGFFISGYTGSCYKGSYTEGCRNWCSDRVSPYFRTAATRSDLSGVAFNTNGHPPNIPSNRLISVGLRYKRDEP